MVDYDIFDNQTVYYKSSENMSELNDESINVIVTSPPYNRSKRYISDNGLFYDDKKSKKEYFNFLERVWRECYRVLNSTGIFFLNIGDAALDQGLSEEVVQLATKVGFHRLQTVIWVKSFLGKGHYTPTGGNRRLNNLWENVFILVKDRKKYKLNPKAVGIPYADRSNIGRYSDADLRDAGNVWLINYSKTTGATIKKGHEAPFPIELPYRCIKLAEGEVVLDPFVGSGSTLAAARNLGKKGIGYEKYPRKDVIKNKILSSLFDFSPTILIPHLELAVKILVRFSQNLNFNQLQRSKFFRFSKKEKIELSVLKDVLSNIGIDLPILNQYFELDNIHKTSKSSISLKDFLLIKEERRNSKNDY